jgi:hypothetical protein
MTQVPVALGEWRPDIADLDNEFCFIADGVFADANSYIPALSQVALTSTALPTLPCVGLFAARKLDKSWIIYAGSRSKLYVFSASLGWTDVSVAGGYHVPTTGVLWTFRQFGTHLYAQNPGDPLQVVDIEAGGAFANATVAPPQADSVAQVGSFLVLTTLSSNARKLQWSAINDPTGWSSGTNLSSIQEMPDGGPVMAVVGSESPAYIVQDRAIRMMQFLPGDTTTIFDIVRVVEGKGAVGEYCSVVVNGTLYFLAEDGFWALSNGQLIPIGQDKVNLWFTLNSDITRRPLVQALLADRPYVVWAYYKTSASANYDGVIIYNWIQQKWTTAPYTGQAFAAIASVGLDLDTTGSETGDALLDSTARSLDSFAYVGGRPFIAAIDANGILVSVTGPPIAATLQTPEMHLVQGQRAFTGDVYLIGDTPGATLQVATRERLADPIVFQPPVPLETTGSAAIYASGRLQRFQVNIPASTAWTHIQAVLANAQADGEVA